MAQDARWMEGIEKVPRGGEEACSVEEGRARVSWLDRMLRAESVSARHKAAYRSIRRGVLEACDPSLAFEVGGPGEYYARVDADPSGPMPPHVVDFLGIPTEVPRRVVAAGGGAGAGGMDADEMARFEEAYPQLKLSGVYDRMVAEARQVDPDLQEFLVWASAPTPDPRGPTVPPPPYREPGRARGRGRAASTR